MLLIFLHLLLVHSSNTCRSLAMSGGGSYGSYQAGAFKALVDLLPPQQVKYNILMGVSSGALNSIQIALTQRGNQKQASELALKFWQNMTNHLDVYKYWPTGVIGGLLFQKGVLDSSPLKQTLQKYYTSIKRNITVGSTNLNTGKYGEFNQTLKEKLIDAVMCSSSVPCMFPFQSFEGELWVDGGLTYNNDYETAVERCLDVTGGKAEDVVVDVINCFPTTPLGDDMEKLNTLDVILRVQSISEYDKSLEGIERAKIAYPGVKFRYYIQPSKELEPFFPLGFAPSELEYNIQTGYNDTVEVIYSEIIADQVLKAYKNKNKVVYIEV